MGRIIISENASLDGVIQDPTGEEGFRYGGWFTQIAPGDLEALAKVLLDEHLGSQALLFGRRTYEFFAARWPSREGALADSLNSMPKYVVSSTLQEPKWANSTVLSGDVVSAVRGLKEEIDGDIVSYGSFQLGRTLIEHDLVDEVRLMIYPVVLGDGERLFGQTSGKVPLRLLSTRVVGDGLALLTYEVARLSGQAGADRGAGAADRLKLVVQDADEVGSGQDDTQLEGELRGVGAGRL